MRSPPQSTTPPAQPFGPLTTKAVGINHIGWAVSVGTRKSDLDEADPWGRSSKIVAMRRQDALVSIERADDDARIADVGRPARAEQDADRPGALSLEGSHGRLRRGEEPREARLPTAATPVRGPPRGRRDAHRDHQPLGRATR